MSGKKYTGEEKYNIIMESFQNPSITIASICRKHGIAASMFYRWKKQFLEGGRNGLAGKTPDKTLLKENAKLKAIIGEMNTPELRTGIELRKEGKLGQATRVFSSYVDKNPKDPFGWYYLAITLDYRSKERDAIPCYKKAISLEIERPLLINAYLFLGSSLRKTGNPTEALVAFQKAESMGCRDAFLFYSKAKAYFLVGNLAEAQKSAELAIKVNPRAPVYRKLLSLIKSSLTKVN